MQHNRILRLKFVQQYRCKHFACILTIKQLSRKMRNEIIKENVLLSKFTSQLNVNPRAAYFYDKGSSHQHQFAL